MPLVFIDVVVAHSLARIHFYRGRQGHGEDEEVVVVAAGGGLIVG